MNLYRILIVDDQPNWREVMTSLLVDVGYEVESADSVAAAWSLLNNGIFDVAIIDVRLVDKNPYDIQGVELLEQMREKLQGHFPIVVMTGYSFEGMEGLLREKYGVQRFVKKGSGVFSDIEAFRAMIASILKEKAFDRG